MVDDIMRVPGLRAFAELLVEPPNRAEVLLLTAQGEALLVAFRIRSGAPDGAAVSPGGDLGVGESFALASAAFAQAGRTILARARSRLPSALRRR